MNEYYTSSMNQYSSSMGERSICYCVAQVNPDLFRPNEIHPDPIRPIPVQSNLVNDAYTLLFHECYLHFTCVWWRVVPRF